MTKTSLFPPFPTMFSTAFFHQSSVKFVVCKYCGSGFKRTISVNFSQNDKILTLTKYSAFADDKVKVTKIIVSVFNMVENRVFERSMVQGR